MTTEGSVRKPSLWSIVLDNVKMLAMYALGAWLLLQLSPALMWGYLAYCLFSILGFIKFICPYCLRYHIRTCKSGYHVFAGIFSPKDRSKFGMQFKRYVAILYPVWFVPPLVGVYLLVTDFSWLVVGQLLVFCLVAFVFLPYISGEHSCSDCEQASECPWRKGKAAPQQ